VKEEYGSREILDIRARSCSRIEFTTTLFSERRRHGQESALRSGGSSGDIGQPQKGRPCKSAVVRCLEDNGVTR